MNEQMGIAGRDNRVATLAQADEGGDGIMSNEIDVKALLASHQELLEIVKEFSYIMENSHGVDGFHLNGEVADWDDFDLVLDGAIDRAEKLGEGK